MIVIAVDPGKTTGVKWIDTEDQALLPQGDELQVEEFFAWMYEKVQVTRAMYPDTEIRIVSESFLITANTAKNSQAGWSLELIGVMKFISWLFQLPPLFTQTPQIAKSFASDLKLKMVDGWYVKGKGHQNDAARHLMTYLVTRKLVFTTDQLKEMALL